MALTSKVFATPGGPSSRTWPPLKRAAKASSMASSWPKTTFLTALLTELYSASRDTERYLCESRLELRGWENGLGQRIVDGPEGVTRLHGKFGIAAFKNPHDLLSVFLPRRQAEVVPDAPQEPLTNLPQEERPRMVRTIEESRHRFNVLRKRPPRRGSRCERRPQKTRPAPAGT